MPDDKTAFSDSRGAVLLRPETPHKGRSGAITVCRDPVDGVLKEARGNGNFREAQSATLDETLPRAFKQGFSWVLPYWSVNHRYPPFRFKRQPSIHLWISVDLSQGEDRDPLLVPKAFRDMTDSTSHLTELGVGTAFPNQGPFDSLIITSPGRQGRAEPNGQAGVAFPLSASAVHRLVPEQIPVGNRLDIPVVGTSPRVLAVVAALAWFAPRMTLHDHLTGKPVETLADAAAMLPGTPEAIRDHVPAMVETMTRMAQKANRDRMPILNESARGFLSEPGFFI